MPASDRIERPWVALPLQKKGLVVLALPLLALFSLAGMFLFLDRWERRAFTEVEQALRRRLEIERAWNLLVEAESSVRGYTLTGREEWLDGYRQARVELPRLLEDLSVSPSLRERLHEIETLAGQRLRLLERLIASSTAPPASRPPASELLLESKKAMDALRAEIEALRAEEARILDAHQARRRRAQWDLIAAVASSVLVGLVGGVVAMWLFTAGIVRRVRRVSENAGRLAGRVPLLPQVLGTDEIGELAQQIEEADAVLASRERTLQAADRELTLAVGARQAAEDEADRFFDQSLDLLGIIGYDGHFKRLNRSWEEVLGCDRDTLMSRPYIEAVHPDDRARTLAEAERLAATKGETVAFDARMGCHDGSYISVAWTARADPERRLVYVVGRDLSERVAAEEALRESRELLVAVLDHSPSLICVKDRDGRFLLVNRGFETLFQATREEIQGKRDHDYFPKEHADTYRAHDLAVWEAGRAIEFVEKIPREDDLHTYVATKFPLRDARGAIHAVCGISVDITDRQRTEAALRMAQKMEAVGRLAGGVAHDFNNLLSVITGYSDLLLRDLGSDHPGRRRLDQIRKAADRAAALTHQLLAFSRKQVLQPRVIRLNAVVADLEPMLHRLIGEHITIHTRLAAEGRVLADPGQMEQVIVNLAVNARDAMPQGGALVAETADVELDAIFVRTHPGSTSGRHVMLAVSDTGHGMDKVTLSRVFEPFFTTKAVGQGTGLGLATVYGIVKQSGGYISVYSEPGQGTTFKVYLPRVAGKEEPGLPAPEAVEPPRSASGTVLVVEDDEALRGIVREVLESAGYAVLIGANPDEALEAASAHRGPIHLLLTDVVMPGRSGRHMAEALRVLRPETRVLYMSGYTGEAISHHAVIDAGTRLLSKPFTAEGLLRSVREAIHAPGPDPSGEPVQRQGV